MTNSSVIQDARDVLAKWRKAARDGEWTIESDTAESSWLGRGTAGNPELLDAIDGMLAHGQSAVTNPMNEFGVRDWAERIAAAIIAADERMSA